MIDTFDLAFTTSFKAKTLFDSFLDNEDSFKNEISSLFGLPYNLIYGNTPCECVLFDLLKHFYHNDYLVRYLFSKKILYKSSAISFFEFPVLDSRADLISINGKSIAYEIKTMLDSFDRLTKQINDYSKCFEYIYIICPDCRINEAMKFIPDYCGIYSYDDSKNDFAFKKVKESLYSPNINKCDMLSTLTKKDLSKLFRTSSKETISENYDERTINKMFKKCLKQKYKSEWESIIKQCDYLIK